MKILRFNMKWIKWIIACSLIFLAACSSQSNTDTSKYEEECDAITEEFMQDLLKSDFDGALALTDVSFQDESGLFQVPQRVASLVENSGLNSFDEEEAKEFEEYYLSKLILAYSILDTQVEDNEARVTVQVKGIDDATVRSTDNIEKIKAKAAKGSDNYDSEEEYLISLLENATARADEITMTYYIDLTNTDNGWKITSLQITY